MPISIIRIGRAVGGRDDGRRDGDEADRGEHRRQAEQHRDAGGQQRAERDDQDDQRDRDRQELGRLEVGGEAVVERLAGRRVAELLDAQRRVARRRSWRWRPASARPSPRRRRPCRGSRTRSWPSGRRRSAPGARIAPTSGSLPSVVVTSAATPARALSVSGPVRLWTNTISVPGWSLKPAASMHLRARPDSPVPRWESSIWVVPTALPTTKQIATNATQPRIARQGCRRAPAAHAVGEVGGVWCGIPSEETFGSGLM